MIEYVVKYILHMLSEYIFKVSNKNFILEDFDWYGYRKNFNYRKINSNTIEALWLR